ncbi:MAG: hypothetical protein DMG59_14220 [Acidobacteria bacterium]|nr:MAG: hypothetical protein DMG59_14220 [Acidobacteriota bacterium]
MRAKIEASLTAAAPNPLVQALLNAYAELKENFNFEKFRPSELEGGRFAEAAIRIVQHLATGSHDPMGKPLPSFDKIVAALEKVASTSAHDSLRIHIPRALWAVYGIRNRRDVGHIGGDVNPNRADAYFVVAICDWVLAEFLRLTFNCSLVEAQRMVDNLVERKVPIIQDFAGFPKILRTDMAIPDRILALAYRSGGNGVAIEDLQKWLKPAKPGPIGVAILRLDRKSVLHRDGNRCFITLSGIRHVEQTMAFVLAG